MASGDNDLTIILALMFIVVLWAAFNGIFFSDQLKDAQLQYYNSSEDSGGLFTNLKANSGFLKSISIESDIAVINQFVVIPVGFILLVLFARFIRG